MKYVLTVLALLVLATGCVDFDRTSNDKVNVSESVCVHGHEYYMIATKTTQYDDTTWVVALDDLGRPINCGAK